MNDIPTSRRKLLQSSLAAPLVLTVASPSALAVTSFNACIARGANESPPSTMFASSPDGWYRKSFDAYRFKLNTGTDPASNPEHSYYYSGNPGRGYRYYRMDFCDATGVAETDIYVGSKTALGKRYALVWVDENGNQVGLGHCGPNGGYAVTTSCWNSFKTQKTA